MLNFQLTSAGHMCIDLVLHYSVIPQGGSTGQGTVENKTKETQQNRGNCNNNRHTLTIACVREPQLQFETIQRHFDCIWSISGEKYSRHWTKRKLSRVHVLTASVRARYQMECTLIGNAFDCTHTLTYA